MLTNVTTVLLYGNLFQSLQSGIFDKLTKLEILNLNINRLTYLPNTIFDKLTALQYLQLMGNRFSSLPGTIFDKLVSLVSLLLSDNPWDCDDCRVQKFGNLTAYKNTQPAERAKCTGTNIDIANAVNKCTTNLEGHIRCGSDKSCWCQKNPNVLITCEPNPLNIEL